MFYSGDPKRWVNFFSDWMGENIICDFNEINLKSDRVIALPPSCRDFYVALDIIGWESFGKIELIENLSFIMEGQINFLAAFSGIMRQLELNYAERSVPMIIKSNDYEGCGGFEKNGEFVNLIAPSCLLAVGNKNRCALVVNPLAVDESKEWKAFYFDISTMRYWGFPSFAHAMCWLRAVNHQKMINGDCIHVGDEFFQKFFK